MRTNWTPISLGFRWLPSRCVDQVLMRKEEAQQNDNQYVVMNWREKSHFALPLGSSNVGTIESMINAMCTSMSLIPLKQRSVTLKQECEKQLPALCFKHLFKHVQLKHSCKKCRHRIWVLFREKKQPLSLCFHERSMLVC